MTSSFLRAIGIGSVVVVTFFGARILSDPIQLQPAVVDLGSLRGKTARATFELVNSAPWSFEIAGITRNCDCLSTEELPTTLPGFGRKSLSIEVDIDGITGEFGRTGAFVIPASRRVHFPFAINGEVGE